MGLLPDGQSVYAFERSPQTGKAKGQRVSLEAFPPELYKKISLLKHFRKYIKKNMCTTGSSPDPNPVEEEKRQELAVGTP